MNNDFGGECESPSTSTATLVYILQAVSFFIGFTFIVAMILNYMKLADTRGTWLESHFLWQLRTFWWSLLWSVLGVILAFFLIGYLLLLVNFIWVIYRIVRGWTNLNDGLAMYT